MTNTPLPANLSTLAPPAFDELVKEAWFAAATAEALVEARMGRLKRAVGDKLVWEGKRQVYRSLDTDTIARAEADLNAPAAGSITRNVGAILAEYRTAVEARGAAWAHEIALQAEYDRRPWPRYMATTGSDAHIHKDMHCSTCNRGAQRTAFVFLTELSGTPLGEALAKFTTTLCTVCYPDAPVLPAAPRKTREQLAADRAEAAERARVAEPKNISDVDGQPLRVEGSTVKTVRAAEIKAVDALWWAASARHKNAPFEPNEPNAQRHEGQARHIAAALAAKNGTTPADELARLTVKAVAKIKKDMGADVAAAAAARWAQQAQDAAPGLASVLAPAGGVVQGVTFDQLLQLAEVDQAAGRPLIDGDGLDVPIGPDKSCISPDSRVFFIGRVRGECGHYVAASERRAGLTTCERCPEPDDDAAEEAADDAEAARDGGTFAAKYLGPRDGWDGHTMPSPAATVIARIIPGEGGNGGGWIGTGAFLEINGTRHPIPDRHPHAGVLAPVRISTAIRAAGYQPAEGYYESLDVDGPGTIRLVPFAGGPVDEDEDQDDARVVAAAAGDTVLDAVLDRTAGDLGRALAAVPAPRTPGPCEAQAPTPAHWSDRMRAQVVETWRETLRDLLRSDGFVPAFILGVDVPTLQHPGGVAVVVDGDGVEITYPDDNVADGEAGEGRGVIRLMWGTDYGAVRDVAVGLVMLVGAGGVTEPDGVGDQDGEQCVGRGPATDDQLAAHVLLEPLWANVLRFLRDRGRGGANWVEVDQAVGPEAVAAGVHVQLLLADMYKRGMVLASELGQGRHVLYYAPGLDCEHCESDGQNCLAHRTHAQRRGRGW
jgi:hypothetical protein